MSLKIKVNPLLNSTNDPTHLQGIINNIIRDFITCSSKDFDSRKSGSLHLNILYFVSHSYRRCIFDSRNLASVTSIFKFCIPTITSEHV